MVIVSVDTNFSPLGNMEMYWDSIPKAITLTVTMVERRPRIDNEWSFSSGSNSLQRKEALSTEKFMK
jgi:hypothetical protein